MSLNHKAGCNRLLTEADKLPAASGEQHDHEVYLHFTLISIDHPVLTKIHLRLLSVRKLLDRLIVPRGSFRLRNIMGFADPLDKGVDRSCGYLLQIRVMLFQPIFDLSGTAVRIVGNPFLDKLFIRLQFSVALLLQIEKVTEFLLGYTEVFAHRRPVQAGISADLTDA